MFDITLSLLKSRERQLFDKTTCVILEHSSIACLDSYLTRCYPNAKLCRCLEKTYTYHVLDLATNAIDLLPIFNSIKILDFPEITTGDNDLTKPCVCVFLACSNVSCLDTYMIDFVVSPYKIITISTLFKSYYKKAIYFLDLLDNLCIDQYDFLNQIYHLCSKTQK
jgi:hypothetical protein